MSSTVGPSLRLRRTRWRRTRRSSTTTRRRRRKTNHNKYFTSRLCQQAGHKVTPNFTTNSEYFSDRFYLNFHLVRYAAPPKCYTLTITIVRLCVCFSEFYLPKISCLTLNLQYELSEKWPDHIAASTEVRSLLNSVWELNFMFLHNNNNKILNLNVFLLKEDINFFSYKRPSNSTKPLVLDIK